MSPHPLSLSGSIRHLVHQAWPVLVGQWAGIALGVLDTAMTGHASAVDLAAMSLSVSIYITVFVGLMGIVHALIPILAHHYGARQFPEVGAAWGQGVWLALTLSVIGGTILLFPGAWLSLSGDVEPAVRARIDGYLTTLAVALPAALVFRTMHSLGAAVSRPQLIMWINLLGVLLKAFFNWVLIFGHFGMPALGAVGAGISTALVFWISVAVAGLTMRRDTYYAKFGLRLGRPHWPTLRTLLRLGLPMGGSYLVEVAAFTFMALIVAREGLVVMGAHQISANVAALCYMAPMAIGIATAAQTGQALGARQFRQAIVFGRAGILLTAGAAIVTVLLVLTGRGWIVQAYTDNAQVAAAAFALLAIVPAFHMADSAQTLVIYLLRAYKVALVPMLVQIAALGGVGLVGGWLVAFGPQAGLLEPLIRIWSPHAPAGAAAMWIMATVGMVLSLIALLPVYGYVVREYPRQHRAARVSGSARGNT